MVGDSGSRSYRPARDHVNDEDEGLRRGPRVGPEQQQVTFLGDDAGQAAAGDVARAMSWVTSDQSPPFGRSSTRPLLGVKSPRLMASLAACRKFERPLLLCGQPGEHAATERGEPLAQGFV